MKDYRPCRFCASLASYRLTARNAEPPVLVCEEHLIAGVAQLLTVSETLALTFVDQPVPETPEHV